MNNTTPEHKRLEENYSEEKDWLKWGSYVSERQWGTVREDYSANGDAWNYFPHEHARSRTYRWGEDGIAGISDRYCNICFGVSLWNGKDAILKERLFGLTGPQGNHGEDVKELYYYLENTPTHSYMKQLYKYPQKAFPYAKLVEENAKRNRTELEYQLLDTGVFDNDEYFDVFTEYAKGDNEDILIKITVNNKSKKAAPLHLLPTLWIRNYWDFKEMPKKPKIEKQTQNGSPFVKVEHCYVGDYNLYFEEAAELLFTENETNMESVYLAKNDHPYKKDLFHKAVTSNDYKLATKRTEGTKFSPLYKLNLKGGESKTIRLRFTKETLENPFNDTFDTLFDTRVAECEDFYTATIGEVQHKEIQKQALAGMLWSKNYYNYDVEQWLLGDSKASVPAKERLSGRNNSWKTLRNHDIMLMPDAWEYPWYAAWDSAFHCVTMALVDANFAKHQLLLFTKEWYMAPNGQIPAYEWNFSDVNPPVQAWATLNVYKTDKEQTGKGDLRFLKKMFNKLALNFTWWVNQIDGSQNNVFEGGFLGLDNIGVFDRSHGVPGGGTLEQVDGTSWMALYCLNMLEISLELALHDDSYDDMAIKYFGHFVFIAEALNKLSLETEGIWDEEEGFFYDKLLFPNGKSASIKIRSIAGMLSIAAVLCIRKETLEKLPKFNHAVQWFKNHRMKTLKYPVVQEYADGDDLLLSLVPKDRLKRLVNVLLDEKEFLSPHGIRSLSKIHETPYNVDINGVNYSINYEPNESTTSLFGGNSNWRGPVWFPLNYLFIQALKEYHSYGGDSLKFEYPTGSKNKLSLKEISVEISKRLISIFEKDKDDNRIVHALHKDIYAREGFKDLILFYEYFDGDNGRGVGASHQTGWTSLVANLIDEINKKE
ncbi:MGH1-like glycoside hydrolase domain-containing protein [Cellulophaga baltica]|uniref:mannosyl-oligosaccharide glucosidase n=1 Tax=Cellulophaga baltica 18 TaxID=1348584 RepID=A0AAU8RB48_9FLAO|nr:glucosidase [Cellulophaga baltica]AIZ40913.1 glucosidase [Cellulophaga baltica 18]MCR1025750.1 glucosidase [Cellulophaga baltica]